MLHSRSQTRGDFFLQPYDDDRCRAPDRPLLRGTHLGGSSQSAVRMLDALYRRAPEVVSAQRVAERRCMALLVVGYGKRFLFWGDGYHFFFFFFFFFNLTYSRWTSSLPSCLWSQRIFPSLPGSRRLTTFYRDASSALLQLVNQWLNFTYSRSRTFRYEGKNTNPTLVRIELATSALAGVQITY